MAKNTDRPLKFVISIKCKFQTCGTLLFTRKRERWDAKHSPPAPPGLAVQKKDNRNQRFTLL